MEDIGINSHTEPSNALLLRPSTHIQYGIHLYISNNTVDWGPGRGAWAGPARPVIDTTAWAGEPHNALIASRRGLLVELVTNLENKRAFGPFFQRKGSFARNIKKALFPDLRYQRRC